MPLQSGKEILSVLEAAAKLNVSRDTIHRLIKAKQLAAHKKTLATRSAFMIDRASVEAYDRARRPVKCKTATLAGHRLTISAV